MRLALAAVATFVAVGNYAVTAQGNGNDNNIPAMDDCLPGDPGWDPTGGCTLNPHQGDVSFAEFGQLLVSPLMSAGGRQFMNGGTAPVGADGQLVTFQFVNPGRYLVICMDASAPPQRLDVRLRQRRRQTPCASAGAPSAARWPGLRRDPVSPASAKSDTAILDRLVENVPRHQPVVRSRLEQIERQSRQRLIHRDAIRTGRDGAVDRRVFPGDGPLLVILKRLRRDFG